MKGELRLRLPPLHAATVDTPTDWAWLERGSIVAHGHDALQVIGERYPLASTMACVDMQDLILLELLLPRVTGRRLQVAMQAEVEALLLEDMADVVYGHGPQAVDGAVSIAWLGADAIRVIRDLVRQAGLSLQGLYPTPLLLPLQSGRASLQECGDYLLVRTSRDGGWVQWRGSHGTDAGLARLHERLRADGATQVQWIGTAPTGWNEDGFGMTLPGWQQLSGPLPRWSLPLPTDARAAPRAALGLLLAAVLLPVIALQVQALRWEARATALQAQAQQQMQTSFADAGEVVDPVQQAQRALAADIVQGHALPELQRIMATTLRVVPELAGLARRMDYRPGELRLQFDDARAGRMDAARLEQWGGKLQAQGLHLVAMDSGEIAIRTGARP